MFWTLGIVETHSVANVLYFMYLAYFSFLSVYFCVSDSNQ